MPISDRAAPCPRILWIDDDLRSDDPVVCLMTLEGFTVECAETGAEGLRRALSDEYHGIILDLRLPDLPGTTVLKRIVHARVSAPVLIFTGYGDVEDAVETMKVGAADFRRKPMYGDELAGLMRSICEGRLGNGRREYRNADLMTTQSSGETVGGSSSQRSQLGVAARSMLAVNLSVSEFVSLSFAFRDATTGRTRPAIRSIDRFTRPSHALPDERRLLSTVTDQLEVELKEGRLPSLDDLARSAGVDRSTVRKVLNGYLRASLGECRRALRLRPALRLVAFSDEQIAQIAYEIGYRHAGQFDRDFRLAFGVRPRQFRRLVGRATS